MDGSQKKIFGAFLVGFVIIAAALWLRLETAVPAGDGGEPVVATTDTPARQLIPVSDKDSDGIPDWQEALQKAEPIILNNTSDNYQPETLTEQFSISFLQDMVLARNYGDFGKTPEELANLASEQLANAEPDKMYEQKDIIVLPDNSAAAKRVYMNQMALIIMENSVPRGSANEIEILKRAYQQENETELENLDSIIAMYKDLIDRSLKTPAPSSYTKEHLDVINVYNAVYNDIVAMKSAFSDPLRTVVRLKRYEEDATGLYVALLNLQKKVVGDNITFTTNDPAYNFIVNTQL